MASAERKRENWERWQAKKAASTFGAPAPADKDERADRERRTHDRYLAQRERDD